MIVLRQAKPGDEDGLMALAEKSGAGLTTLPADPDTIVRRIAAASVAFGPHEDEGNTQDFFMVAEDTQTGQLIGTSAILAYIGRTQPFYCYRLMRLTQMSKDPAVRVDTELLQMTNDYVGSAEVATLFLDPDFRSTGAGKLLAKGRYMLMAAFPDEFPDRVLAEIRGWLKEDETSPFWEAIGRHFFGMSYPEADEISGMGNSQFIADLMPKFPIYTALLPEEARDIIGKPHDAAVPAVRLLEREGFRFAGSVDIFDGWPNFEVPRANIWTTQHAQKIAVAGWVESSCTSEEATHIVSTAILGNFRAVLTKAVETDGGLYLPQDCANVLGVETGDPVWFCPLSHKSLAPEHSSHEKKVTRELND